MVDYLISLTSAVFRCFCPAFCQYLNNVNRIHSLVTTSRLKQFYLDIKESLCASSPEIPLKLWNETKIVETTMGSRCHHPIKRAHSKLFKTINGTKRWNSPPWRKVLGISKEKNKWRWYQMYCDEKVRQAAVATDIFGPLKQHFATTLIVSPVS